MEISKNLFQKGETMKKLLIVVLLLACAGITKANDPNDKLTFWAGGFGDVGEVRLGYMVKLNIEAGGFFDWQLNSPPPKAAGGFCFYHLPNPVKAEFPIPIEGLDEIEAWPYGGVAVMADFGDGYKQMRVGGIAGLRYFEYVYTEVRYGKFTSPQIPEDNNEWQLAAGMSLRF
jgi:hypothetical protein